MVTEFLPINDPRVKQLFFPECSLISKLILHLSFDVLWFDFSGTRIQFLHSSNFGAIDRSLPQKIACCAVKTNQQESNGGTLRAMP